MINKDRLTEKQAEKFEEIRYELGHDIWQWFKTEQEAHDPELFAEICSSGIDMVVLLQIYKEQLEEQKSLPLSAYREEMQNFNIVLEYIGNALTALMKKGTTIEKQFSNDEE